MSSVFFGKVTHILGIVDDPREHVARIGIHRYATAIHRPVRVVDVLQWFSFCMQSEISQYLVKSAIIFKCQLNHRVQCGCLLSVARGLLQLKALNGNEMLID